MGNIIIKVARLFDLGRDEEKLNYLSKQLDEKLLDYGANPSANMTQYLFQGIKILEYGKNNPHSQEQLIVIQSHNYFYCEELLEEIKSASNLKEGISVNGFPVLTGAIDGHSLTVHLGDEKIATRYTIRISKKANADVHTIALDKIKIIDKMNVTQQFVKTLFSKDTISKVKSQFKNGNEICIVNNYDMNFRLLKTGKNTINLQAFVQYDPNDGNSEIVEVTDFFKTIGYYELTKSFLSDKIKITVVKEFEEDIATLKRSGSIPNGVEYKKLTLKENAIIGAFSMEAVVNAKEYKDCNFQANGLDFNIYMTHDNSYPQSFLDDKYGTSGPIAGYLLRDKGTINPMIEYKRDFDRLYSMELLSAYIK